MNLREYLSVSSEVSCALRDGKPVTAIAATLFTHSIPFPDNLSLAFELDRIIREEGCIPAVMCIIRGVLHVGLDRRELETLCRPANADADKISRRDLPVAVAQKRTGATTTSASMILASLVGIRVLAGDGIGGMHFRGGTPPDISADLQELRKTSAAVVCSGTRILSDAENTLEYLETMGVPVLGLKTDDFPGYYCRKSGFPVDCMVSSESEAAHIMKTKWDLGLAGGLLICSPVPENAAMTSEEVTRITELALQSAAQNHIRGSRLTPYLLARIAELSQGRSVKAGIALTCGNARAAARIARSYAALEKSK